MIDKKNLARKYAHGLHANEIVLLAYYIAAVNIENAYHDLLGAESEYQSFDGICLTDTFQLGEGDGSEEFYSEMFPKNSERVENQKKAPIRVIMGNPPYSKGQKSANDNAQNQAYPVLDLKIADSYVAKTKATNKNAIYDSYIKAFRWSTDRLDPEQGVIVCFVSNSGWLDGGGMDGLRKCIERGFSSIYVFNLRGNQRTSGELSRKEGGKIFGSGSRTPIAITLLVKNPTAKTEKAHICYQDIGDYLKREEKLERVKKFGSVSNPKMNWLELEPNKYGDWISHRNDLFGTFISIAPGEKYEVKSQSYFLTYFLGLAGSLGHLNLVIDLAGYDADIGKPNRYGDNVFAPITSMMQKQALAEAHSGKSLGKADDTELSPLDAGLALLALLKDPGPISRIPGADGPPPEPDAYISSVVEDARIRTPGQLVWLKALVAAGAPIKYEVTFSDGQTKTFYVKDKINPEFMAWLPGGAIAQAAYDFLTAEESKQKVAGLSAKPRDMHVAQAKYQHVSGNKAYDQNQGRNIPRGFGSLWLTIWWSYKVVNSH